MFLPSHLRRSRHGVYKFRLVLPPVIAELLGQREILRSLHTKCPNEAKNIGYQLSGKLFPILLSLRRVMPFDLKNLKVDDIRKMVIDQMTFDPNGAVSVTGIKTSDDPAVAARELAALAATIKSTRSPVAPARIEMDQRIVADAVKAAVSKQPLSQEPLAQASASYLKFKHRLAPKSLKSYKASLHLFQKMCGGPDRMVHTITESDCLEFNRALTSIPLHATKRHVAIKPAAQMIAEPYPEDMETLSAQSCNQHLTNLTSFFNWAIKSGIYASNNPISGLPRHTGGNDPLGAEPFTHEELKKIFNPTSLLKLNSPHEYWGPIFSIFTGARANELACLELVNFVEQDGRQCISIRNTRRQHTKAKIVHQDKVNSAPQRTKNKESIRILPLHPTLVELGLLDYLDDLKQLGATRLFPTLPVDEETQKRERNLSRAFSSYLKEIGVHEFRTKVLHSFRDTVSDALGESNMDDAAADRWTGHAPKGVKAQAYRKAAPTRMAASALNALKWEFLPWSELKYKKGRWNKYIMNNMVD